MKDKSIIWISAAGVAIWVWAAYPPARNAAAETVKAIWSAILSKF
ncbi:MAG TPA: hypothetical protein VLX58_11760 [Bryobacteraceae bacterium]|nr:hypothetical protein [Bryobacteraceae bacterium]